MNTLKRKLQIQKAANKYYRKNRDKRLADMKIYDLKKKYSITPEQLEVMYKEQDNCCKICNTHKDNTKMGLVIDHCHKTLEVRGLLCHNCNVALGHLKDDTELLDKAKQYLKTNGKFN